MRKPVKKPPPTAKTGEIGRLGRQAKTFKRYEDAYKIVRASARHLQRLEQRGDASLAREVRGIGVLVLRRLAADMRGEDDAHAIFEEVSKAIGKVIPLFSKTLFKKPPRVRVERPAVERRVPRTRVDGALTGAALVRVSRRAKTDDIEGPEALRWYAKFMKAAPELAVKRDAWRRGRALLKEAQREARRNNFLAAYYEKKMLKFEAVFFGETSP